MPSSGFPGFPAEALQFPCAGLRRTTGASGSSRARPSTKSRSERPCSSWWPRSMPGCGPFARSSRRSPQRAVYRIYRDTRFSHDKDALQDSHRGLVHAARFREALGRGLLISASRRGDRRRGGVYMPSPEELRSIRLHLLENHAEFDRILSRPMVRKTLGSLAGEKLSRVPKGFPAEHPSASLVQHKQWCCGASWTRRWPPRPDYSWRSSSASAPWPRSSTFLNARSPTCAASRTLARFWIERRGPTVWRW